MIGTEPRLSITHTRAGARRMLVVDGHVDLDGAPRLAEVLQRAGVRHELATDRCDARVHAAASVALLLNPMRRLHRRRPDATIVGPRGPTRAGRHRAGPASRDTLVADRAALVAGLAQRRRPRAAG